jgi:hypothetical protein
MRFRTSTCKVFTLTTPAEADRFAVLAQRIEARDARQPAPGAPSVVEFRFASGKMIQNRRGRCEDAPCCGCCTF